MRRALCRVLFDKVGAASGGRGHSPRTDPRAHVEPEQISWTGPVASGRRRGDRFLEADFNNGN